ncbi:hypothetical protein N865_19160 [Intrasporangium oryzae NRRL B-24470]|uniref:Uncharacterized protein n=1 Tax=Intrasporangium oryzae NRRL B-24470 TaxID=1386089 RepID=W9GHG2_9MICO|nr:DUF5995 family protein [Intrasporangium oryzae]EWT03334.1 hypothetical protein N865_19160 [Intrasporangium oryzae NRRL B-24470]
MQEPPHDPSPPARPDPIDAVLADMQDRLDAMPPELSSQRAFLGTYRRTTLAVEKAIRDGVFEDPAWVAVWDAAFARLYLDALDARLSGGLAPRPWRLAFDAPSGLPPLRHVLLGINAHINYDLPQALLAVISDEDFLDPTLLDRRHRDHERIDGVLAARVAAEDDELSAVSARSLLDRVLQPLNHRASQRFLREARIKVWHNTRELQQARLAGPGAYAARLAELEVLSAARLADLTAPGQVLLRLAVAGFGVLLPPPAEPTPPD